MRVAHALLHRRGAVRRRHTERGASGAGRAAARGPARAPGPTGRAALKLPRRSAGSLRLHTHGSPIQRPRAASTQSAPCARAGRAAAAAAAGASALPSCGARPALSALLRRPARQCRGPPAAVVHAPAAGGGAPVGARRPPPSLPSRPRPAAITPAASPPIRPVTSRFPRSVRPLSHLHRRSACPRPPPHPGSDAGRVLGPRAARRNGRARAAAGRGAAHGRRAAAHARVGGARLCCARVHRAAGLPRAARVGRRVGGAAVAVAGARGGGAVGRAQQRAPGSSPRSGRAGPAAGAPSTPNSPPAIQPQGVPGQRVVVPFLTHFGDLTSWELAQKLQKKALAPLQEGGVKVWGVGGWGVRAGRAAAGGVWLAQGPGVEGGRRRWGRCRRRGSRLAAGPEGRVWLAYRAGSGAGGGRKALGPLQEAGVKVGGCRGWGGPRLGGCLGGAGGGGRRRWACCRRRRVKVWQAREASGGPELAAACEAGPPAACSAPAACLQPAPGAG
jgi:hypothetical protein